MAELVVRTWTDDPTPDGEWIAPYHLHLECPERWLVRSGVLEFVVAGRRQLVQAGEEITVPPGTPHTFRNPGPDPAEYEIHMTQRTWDLIQAIHRPGANIPDLFASHGAVLVPADF